MALDVLTTAVPSAARTASGNSSTFDATGAGQQSGIATSEQLRAQLNVSAASGTTPTLDVVIEDSLDGTNWNTIGTFAQLAAAGRQVINITTPFGPQVRVRWTIGGTTPSFTFSVAIAHDKLP